MQLIDLSNWRRILASTKSIAVVGLSPKPERPSNDVARYLLSCGYRVLPVNPGQEQILGLPCYPDLSAAARALEGEAGNSGEASDGGRIDLVDIFRRSDQVLPVVEEAIAVGSRAVWLQEGVINDEAAELAAASGLSLIMDRCIKTVHSQLFA